MIVVVITPSVCPKCKEYTKPGQRVERIYEDFDKDIYKDYHVQCLRKPKEPTNDINQMDLI